MNWDRPKIYPPFKKELGLGKSEEGITVMWWKSQRKIIKEKTYPACQVKACLPDH